MHGPRDALLARQVEPHQGVGTRPDDGYARLYYIEAVDHPRVSVDNLPHSQHIQRRLPPPRVPPQCIELNVGQTERSGQRGLAGTGAAHDGDALHKSSLPPVQQTGRTCVSTPDRHKRQVATERRVGVARVRALMPSGRCGLSQ